MAAAVLARLGVVVLVKLPVRSLVGTVADWLALSVAEPPVPLVVVLRVKLVVG